MTLHAEQAHTSMAAPSETTDVAIDCVLFDLDGVVYHGSRAVDGAAEGINWLHSQHIPVSYVTNNATRTPEATAEKITGVGISVSADEVTTSAQVLAERLAERFGPGARIHLLGTTGLRIALEDAGLEITDTLDAKPVAIAQGLDPNIDYQAIVTACGIIRSGAEWWASNPDFSLITESGEIPGNGAFIDLIARLTDAEPVIVGKPAPHMMEFAANRLRARRPLMVGDRLDTDILGAHNVGVDSLLVMTGVTSMVEAVAAPAQLRPTHVAADLSGLLRPRPEGTLHGVGDASCGGWRAEGARVAILSFGTRLAEVMRARESLAARGLAPTVADARFAKPLDRDLILRLVREHEALITIEEGAIGGFGSHVAQLLAEEGVFDRGLRFRSMVLPDTFIDHGNPADMYAAAAMNAPQIEAKVLELLGVAVARRA